MSISHTTKIQEPTPPVDRVVMHILLCGVNKVQVPFPVIQAAPWHGSAAKDAPIIQPSCLCLHVSIQDQQSPAALHPPKAKNYQCGQPKTAPVGDSWCYVAQGWIPENHQAGKRPWWSCSPTSTAIITPKPHLQVPLLDNSLTLPEAATPPPPRATSFNTWPLCQGKFVLIFSLNLPWWNGRPFSLILKGLHAGPLGLCPWGMGTHGRCFSRDVSAGLWHKWFFQSSEGWI